MTHFYIEPRTRKYIKGYVFFPFARNLSDKYGKKIAGYCYNKRIRCYKKFIKRLKQQKN